MKKKICYVLPKYGEADHTHFAHIYDFLKEVTKQADIFLLIEEINWGKSDTLQKSEFQILKNQLGVKELYFQKDKGILGCIRNLIGLFKARRANYKNFYIHYSFLSAFNASLIAKIFGGNVFYWNCGLPWQYQRSWLREFFERQVYQMIDYLVTGTDFLADQYSKHYKIKREKIKIMPNWISLERFQPDEKQITALRSQFNLVENDKILLFVHRLSKRKGVHFLAKIFQQIKNSNKKLIVIGDGPERRSLELEVNNLGLEKNIKVLGWVPNKELPNYYALADVFLMPSEEEGFPRVLLEAMAVGTPFVAFDVGGVKEVVFSDFLANIVSAGDIDGFVLAIERILGWDEIERLKWKKIAIKCVAQYETSQVVNRFLKIF